MKKYCYFCKYYKESYFCGYEYKSCQKYGSLDIDQEKRHPDITANTCPDYVKDKNKIRENKELFDFIRQEEKEMK